MQNEECLKLVAESDARFKKQIEELEKQKRISRQRILDQWAKDNAKYKVGDIIKANDVIIKVTRIRGHLSLYMERGLYVSYYGDALTKKLTPRKDGWQTDIHDDGGRVIEKLK